ncbi:MAG: hypothetical protein ACRCZ0_01175 [Cetobacterium sp.]
MDVATCDGIKPVQLKKDVKRMNIFILIVSIGALTTAFLSCLEEATMTRLALLMCLTLNSWFLIENLLEIKKGSDQDEKGDMND